MRFIYVRKILYESLVGKTCKKENQNCWQLRFTLRTSSHCCLEDSVITTSTINAWISCRYICSLSKRLGFEKSNNASRGANRLKITRRQTDALKWFHGLKSHRQWMFTSSRQIYEQPQKSRRQRNVRSTYRELAESGILLGSRRWLR